MRTGCRRHDADNCQIGAFILKTAIAALACITVLLAARPAGATADMPVTPGQIAEVETKAKAGDAGAQNTLAGWYADGSHGFARDARTAEQWYLKAAEQGDVAAETALGELYESGSGVQNPEEAVRWYRKAAKTSEQAMCGLGRMYASGSGVPQDYHEAADLYLTAQASHTWCQYELAQLYDFGLGVPRNPKRAMELYYVVAFVNAEAQRRLFALYEAGMGVPLDEGQAIAWYRAAAAKGDLRAEIGLGLHYQFGRGVAANSHVAYALYILASQTTFWEPTELPDFTTEQRRYALVTQDTLKLVQEMAMPGNLLKALDYYIAHPPPRHIVD
jgi:TPR repeat protein